MISWQKSIIDKLGQKHQLNSLVISASIGIVFYPKDGVTVEELLKNADNAMYAAKRAGKNCWRFYSDNMQKEAYDIIHLPIVSTMPLKNNYFSNINHKSRLKYW